MSSSKQSEADTTSSTEEYDWAKDTDPFFIFLGIYVASFQWIEGKLEEIILLHAGYEKRQETLTHLAGLKCYQKIADVASAAIDPKRFPRTESNAAWIERVSALVKRLDEERLRRNSILHSQYWLRGLERGMNAIRSNKKRENGTVEFDSEEINRALMDATLNEVSILAFETGKMHLQLVAWVPD